MGPNATPTYRPEIDGLRALAVIPVVLYHAGVAIPGGFVGVDVFFVISGFLIASILIRECADGTFRFGNFWQRRLRRLFPAWVLVVAVTVVAGGFLFIPAHLEALGESLLWQPTLSANFYYWRQTGYFEPESDWQPLLHTWSLAVEEQFYLVFPLVFFWVLRFGRRVALIVVAAFWVTSFAVCLYATERHPGFAFFLPPARIWELNTGVLLALLSGCRGMRSPLLRESLGWAGLAMIIAAYFSFGPNTAFPGSAALLPCLGTALVIAGNWGGLTLGGRALAHPLPVWIGKISYPLYLWHWPALVALNYLHLDDPPFAQVAATCLLSVLLAWITWRWIERPIREGRRLVSSRVLWGFAGACSVAILATGVILKEGEGFPGRFEGRLGSFGLDEIKKTAVLMIDRWENGGGPSRIGDPTGRGGELLLWGDSHALALTTVFDRLGKEHGVAVTVAAMAGTPPVLNAFPAGKGRGETVYADQVVAHIRERGIREVVIVAKWPIYLVGRSSGRLDRILRDDDLRSDTVEEAAEVFLRRFPETLRTLEALGCRVRILRTVGLQERSVPEALAQIAIRGGDPNALALTAEVHRARDARVNELLDLAVAGSGVEFLDPLPFLTDASGLCPMAREGKALYLDRDHLSPYGSLQLAPLLEPVIEGIVP